MSTTPVATNLPTRSASDADDVIPDEDASEVSKLFHERLQAWKHLCGDLEDYITAVEKHHSHTSKEYEKTLKPIKGPLREANHFDQNVGGVNTLVENLRSNTQALSNAEAETAKSLKSNILPIFERLHAEIKHKTKELTKGVGKGAKSVDKARTATQKHIELLGQHTAAYDHANGKDVKSHEDPYLLQRQVYHRLNKQIGEENGVREDMLAVQSNFAQFEAHVVQTFQAGIAQFNQVIAAQAEQTRTLYGNVAGTAQSIPTDFEWNGFVRRNANVLIDPSAPKRSVDNVAFPNQNHASSQPLIAGSLERKSGMLKKYDTGYYVVTPSKYLHEFKSDDDFAKDPSPENSLYLPDCLTGAVDGEKFNVRGKDSSKGALAKLAMTKEFEFKAHSAADAQKWHAVIARITGSTPESPVGAAPVSATQPAETAAATDATSTTATTGAISGSEPAAATAPATTTTTSAV